MTKKVISIILALCMCLALIPAVYAEPAAKDLEGKIVILHTNDVHGAVAGYAYAAALKTAYTERGADVILADAGDYSQGSPYVSTSKGSSAIAMMNAAGYDIATLGNHEFDYGYAQLVENLSAAEFEVVCADVVDEEGASICDGYAYTDIDGVKLGFVGLETPEAQTKANPALIKGLTFFAGEDLYECAQKNIDAARADGVDILIGLVHLGVDGESVPNTSYDLWNNTEGFDFIIDGHSHTVMTEGKNNEPIQSTGTAFANVGVIVIDEETKAIEDNYLEAVTEESLKDEAVEAKAAEIIAAVDEAYGEVFASSEVELNGDKAPNGNRDSETNLGDLITDAMLWTVLKDEDSIKVAPENVVAITNGGGIRAWIHKGDISKKDVNTVLPFGNTVALVYVTGAELLEALEASTYCTPTSVGGFPQIAGMKIIIDTDAEFDANEETYPGSTYYGPRTINRVQIASVNGKPFDAEAVYAVVTNNFCAAGGDTYYAFAAAAEQFDTGIPLDEALMNYITEELDGVIGEAYAKPAGRISFGNDFAGKIVILHTNDVHGSLDGYAYAAQLKAEYIARGAEVILADAGDFSQGSPYVSTSKGASAVEMMNAAGYDIATLGNHEFDYGYAQLAENLESAAFKTVCADILGEEDASIFAPYEIIDVDGVKVAFIGLDTPEAQTKVNPALIKGLTFFAGEDLYKCAQDNIDAAKADGADIVIGLVHLGVDAESVPHTSYDLWNNTEGFDFIIDGHSHTVMTKGDNDEPIQSTGTAFANIGVIVIDKAEKAIEDNYLEAVTEDTAKDTAVEAKAAEIIAAVDEAYGEVFATSEVELNGDKAPNGNRDSETNLGDLITDAMLWTVLKDEGSIKVDPENVVAITNGGGIRAWIHKGDISKKDVNTVLPFGNTVAVVYVKGSELLEALEASTYCTPTSVGGFPQVAGLKFVINTDEEYAANEETYPASTYYGPASIKRVTITEVNGKAFDEDAVYAVVTNNFCAAGGDTYYAFAAATEQFDTGIPLDEALMDYITDELGGVIGKDYEEPAGRIALDKWEKTEITKAATKEANGTVTFTSTLGVEKTVEYMMYDTDGDLEITPADARLALRQSVNLEDLDFVSIASADVDGEEGISPADARLILRASVGLFDE